jgi:uncharacterized protein involved in exopolysaccharide biosynthesis
MEPDVVTDVSGDAYQPYNYYILAEPKKMTSDIVLSNVVQSLTLNEAGEKHYSNDAIISTAETIKLIRQQLAFECVSSNLTIKIKVTDEDPNKASRIANAVANAYQNYRIDQHRQQMAGAIKLLEKDYQAEEVKIQAMQAQLEHLKKESEITNSERSFTFVQNSTYSQAKQHLDDMERLHQMLKSRIQTIKTYADSPMHPLVTIVEPALPPKTPVGPSRLTDAILLFCGLMMSGFGIRLMCTGAKIR